MPVGELASREPVTAEKNASITDVAGMMKSENVGDVIVTDGNKPVGIVTDRNIALAVGDGANFDSQTAGDLMSEDLVTIEQNEEGSNAYQTMGKNRIRRLPVVDDNGELVGIVTLDDVVATVGEELEHISTVIEAESPGYSPS